MDRNQVAAQHECETIGDRTQSRRLQNTLAFCGGEFTSIYFACLPLPRVFERRFVALFSDAAVLEKGVMVR